MSKERHIALDFRLHFTVPDIGLFGLDELVSATQARLSSQEPFKVRLHGENIEIPIARVEYRNWGLPDRHWSARDIVDDDRVHETLAALSICRDAINKAWATLKGEQ